MDLVSMIVPCYNESSVLRMFYREVSAVINSVTDSVFELIFVDDGSSDGTLNVLTELAAYDDRVKYISFSRNFGKEAAMLAGLERASGDYVGFMDADLQHTPELIPIMLNTVKSGRYDIAACCRVNRTDGGGLRARLSDAFYKLINKVSDVKMNDGAQDYRIMTRQVADAMLAMKEYNRFTKGMFSFVGYRTAWIPHEDRERAAGESKWSFMKLVRYAADGIMGYTSFPLKLPLYAGFFMGLLAVVLLIADIVTMILGNSRFVTLTGIVVLFTSSLLLISAGFIGMYVGRIYDEVKRRPVYFIARTNFGTDGGAAKAATGAARQTAEPAPEAPSPTADSVPEEEETEEFEDISDAPAEGAQTEKDDVKTFDPYGGNI